MLARRARCAVALAFATCSLLERPAPAEGGACTQNTRAALGEIACEIAAALGPAAQGAIVVAAPLATDLEPNDPERLVSRMGTLVAGALGGSARAAAHTATLQEARRLAQGAGPLVYLSPRLTRERLEVSAEQYPVPRRFWQRVKNPSPGASAHTFAARALDAELRSFLPPVPLVARRTDKARGPDPDLVALACGDTDGDGSSELVVVGRRRISVGRVRAEQFKVEKSMSWNDLTPIAPSPLREPISSAWVARAGVIEIGSSDRAEAVRLDAALAKTASLGRTLPWPGGGCARLEGLALSTDRCAADTSETQWPPFQTPIDALAGASLSLRDGGRRLVRAGRNSQDASVTLVDSSGAKARLERAGAQLALGDLDGDGSPELVSSIDTLEPKDDAIVVQSWQPDGKLKDKLRIAIPAGVRAIAICPFEGAGIAPIAVGTSEGLWIVR
ncbi:MAG TPA: hypothetical protein VGP93_09965 [Polyangiaceae bacterium]|nr:hypothetical protein [Polyangiaceae bacterium]